MYQQNNSKMAAKPPSQIKSNTKIKRDIQLLLAYQLPAHRQTRKKLYGKFIFTKQRFSTTQ